MTGYGKAECLLADKKLTIEIKSLNSKQLDVNTRLPSLYKEKEINIRQVLASELERGKVECSFYYELSGEAVSGTINEPVVKDYYQQLYRISGELGLQASLELLTTVMRMPDTIRTEKPELQETEWTLVEAALRKALEQVNIFRKQEGESLDGDLRQRVDAITRKLEEVELYEKERIDQVRERIGKHLEEFGLKESVDENRFEQELIYYIEKLDVSEEKVRLANHCKYFMETLEDQKANHKELQKLVVEMKDELERIKEQILNVL